MVTAMESQEIGKLPPSIRHGVALQRAPHSGPVRQRIANAKTERQALVQQIVNELRPPGTVLSTREMAALLSRRGLKVSHVTVAKDYKEIGLAVGSYLGGFTICG